MPADQRLGKYIACYTDQDSRDNGHCYGQRTISRAFVARRHLAMPATTDYWVNDRAGDPLLLIPGDVNAALTKAFPDPGTSREWTVVGLYSAHGKIFCSALAEAYDEVNRLAIDDVQHRLLAVLKALAKKFGRPLGELVEIATSTDRTARTA